MKQKATQFSFFYCFFILISWFGFAPKVTSAMVDLNLPKAVELSVYGAAYLSEMQPLLDDFHKKNPTISIQYYAVSSNQLVRHIREDNKPRADLTISSVMDLQIQLVNDGYALPYKMDMLGDDDQSSIIPRWSNWRDELFGFSFEPSVMVFNKAFLADKEVPSDRIKLLSFIRHYSEQLVGKIGVYDIRTVGIGYLLWSFERVQAANNGQFLELFNHHNARTFESTSSMLQALSNGEILMAYNIMGSYAKSWQEKHQDLVVVTANDYTPVVIRSVFINKTTTHPKQAKQFVDYLLSYSGQMKMAEKTNMPPVRTDIRSKNSAYYMREQYANQLKPLPLDVSLLIFSDHSKKEIVITEWENALKQYD